MNVTMDGMLSIAKLLMLSGLIGFSFTVGVWAFCWAFKWAPVNITINTTVHEDQ